ncbi:hypothetical protein SPRG_18936 [Saprolegnia parasitica CBS 223.65]|uniref:Alcohol dehydrogenase-like N-terminal domain-containing protein n=1 Tax=Saprolegnia parasitica (strain CBS 223.65) TaxID=695850 RepID=A0A067CVK5_SAPPC|nr:hypothetical protein SPRG_18936 [Saprolegnia parasitica CBS 223.65]KDO34699.1 hypothetical protein SPRG_18936 [Saprolegnia parasitica CBS 223.65]|eukprot:XP_012194810.1 hypothetical protein SPRG_18936 [Saprolegnia parasitica CBS 223.65]
MASNNIYHGQAAFEPSLDVKPHTYAAKPFDEEYDVEIKVTHCGICGSDLHTLTGGWGEIKYPMVVGHEILGHVVRVGSKQECKDVLGAHAFLNYNDPAAAAAAAQQLDLVLCTSYGADTNWGALFNLVATEGKFVLIAVPEKPISFHAFAVVPRQITIVGSIIGSPSMIEEMLQFAVEKNVRSIVQVMPMAEAAAALQKVHNGDVRFRIVLEN